MLFGNLLCGTTDSPLAPGLAVHNFAHNFILQCCSFQISSDGGQHGRTKVHTGRDAGSVFVWHFQKINGILALLHKEGVLCVICTVACPDAIKWVTSSSRNVVCTATACSASAQPSAPVLLAFFTAFCFVYCFAGFARECG